MQHTPNAKQGCQQHKHQVSCFIIQRINIESAMVDYTLDGWGSILLRSLALLS